MQKKPYRSQQQIDRSANILYLTRKLASELGYEGLTMRGLANAANVSPKTLYNLFNSKDELIAASLQDLVGIMRKDQVKQADLDGFEHILMTRKIATETIVRSPGFADVIVTLFFKAKPNDPLVSALLGERESSVVKALQYEHQQGNILDGIDPKRVSVDLAAQSWSTLLEWNKGVIKLKDIVVRERRRYITTFTAIAKGDKRVQLELEMLRLHK